MRNIRIKDIEMSNFLDNDGKFKIVAFKTFLKENSIRIRESIRNDELEFKDFNEEQKKAILNFISWYHD